MLNEGAQQRLVVADGVGGQLGLHHEIVKLNGREVGQPMGLGVTPDQLDRIEVRGIGGQQMGAHVVAVLCEPTGDRLEAVGPQAIPDQRERCAQRAPQLLEERQDGIAIVIGLRQEPEVSAQVMATRRDHQRTDDRDLAPRATALQQLGRATARGPGAPPQRPHQKSGFVDEDERRTAAAGVFFTRGQVW